MDLAVGSTAFDTYSALTTGRQAVFSANRGTDARFEPQANQAGRGQDNSVVLASIELGHTVVDVATQEPDFPVRTARQQLGLTAQTGGADHAACGQGIEAGIGVGNEGIARIFTLADAVQA